MLVKKEIPHFRHEHFNPKGESMGMFNELEHLDLRVRITECKLPGYYILVKGEEKRFDILPNGTLEDCPEVFYSQALDYCLKLRTLQLECKKDGKKN